MNTILLVILNLVMLFVILPFGLYLIGRVFIPVLGEKDTIFSSPKLGRIKGRRRGGRFVGFFGNLVKKGKHVNTETGKIDYGEVINDDFWWKHFGAYFIGLDEVYTYKIATEADEGSDGELRFVEKEASSIFLENSFPLRAQFITKDGVPLKMSLQLKLTTIDAAKALSLAVSWTVPIFANVLAASRDFFGTRSGIALISTQNEAGEITIDKNLVKNSDFIQHILNLNKPKVGNISLEELCGQRIDAVNLIDIGFADEESKKAFSAPFIAEQLAQKQVKEAEAYANAIRIRSLAEKHAATDIAAAIKTKGEAEADVYGIKCEKLGGDSRATAQVITAEKQSTMVNLTTLVNGGGTTISIPADNKREVE